MTTIITKRVATQGASAGSGATYGNYFWLGWANAWANCWRGIVVAAGAASIAPAVDVTPRIPATSASSHPTPVSVYKIDAGPYQGHYKYLGSLSGINHYFVFSGMTLSDQFSSQDILDAADVALRLCVVAARANSRSYDVPFQLMVLDQKVFFLNTPGLSNSVAPSTAGITGPGQFLYENEGVENFAIWESTKITLPGGTTTMTFPASWSWFLADISASLLPIGTSSFEGILAPDSTDAFTGTLLAAVARANPPLAWLTHPSGVPSYTRIELLAKLALENITNAIDPTSGLAYTFQEATHPDGTSYNISFLADNVEVYKGLLGLATLHTTVGNTAAAAAATAAAATLKTKILALYDAGVGRFRTYYGQTDHGSLTGNAAFVTNLRFHLWPAVYDILTAGELATYRDGVVTYTIANTPDIFNALPDDFPLAEWYWAVGLSDLAMASTARTELLARIHARAENRRTLMDLALGGDVDAFPVPFVGTRRIDATPSVSATKRVSQ